LSDSVAYPWSGGLRSSSRKRRLLFASIPFMAIGFVLLIYGGTEPVENSKPGGRVL